MRQWEHSNMKNFKCPICLTNADRPVVFVGIPGTEDGDIIECKQVHSECYKLYCKMRGITIETEE